MPRPLSLLAALALVLAACEAEDPTDKPPEEAPPPQDDPDPPAEDEEHTEDTEIREGVWEELPDAPIEPRLNHTATWADGVLIVWGGEDQDTFEIRADGATFDPDLGEWREIDAAPIDARWAHEAVWTGEELIVWGGTAGPDHLAACYVDGARYDPADDEWQAISEAPGGERCGAAVVWADDELLVFGGHEGNGAPGLDDHRDDGVAYDPETDEWREIASEPVAARAGAVAAWTGSELIVYGGTTYGEDEEFEYLVDGAAYDPATDEWRTIADAPLPPRSGLTGLWVGDELLVFGGDDPDPEGDGQQRPAAAYDPAADDWRTLADTPWALTTIEAVGAGDDVVYVLGSPDTAAAPEEDDANDAAAPSFVAYVVTDDAWVERPDPPAGPRTNHAMDWTGRQLVVWGGQAGDDVAPGAVWSPPGPVDDDEVTLTVEPECAEVGDGFTVTATGLDAGEEYTVVIDPRHADQLEPGAMGVADDDGNLELPASLPEDTGVRTGDYTISLSPFEEDETLATTDFEIADTCP